MKRIRQVVTGLSLVLMGMFLPSIQADELDKAAESTGYTYKINYPENQTTAGGALKLKMAPKQSQDVTVELENYSEEDMVIDLSLNGARTNGNGVLEYGPSVFEKDDSMKYDLPDLVSIPESITIPAKGKTDLVLTIQMPDAAFDGIVTGGIEMQRAGQVEEADTSGQTIINKVAYLFGVTLSMTDATVSPELNLKKVYPELANYSNAIFLDLANTTAVKVEDLVVDAVITGKGSQEIVYESKKANMAMAPNSLMAFPISLAGEEMVAGQYLATVKASNGEKEWSWTEEFEITDEEADTFNQGDVTLVQVRGLDWKLIGGIVLASLFVIAGILLIIQTVRRKKTRQGSKKNKN